MELELVKFRLSQIENGILVVLSFLALEKNKYVYTATKLFTSAISIFSRYQSVNACEFRIKLGDIPRDQRKLKDKCSIDGALEGNRNF